MLKRSLKPGGDKRRDGSDDQKKPGDGKTRITDFFQVGHEEEKKRERESKRAELKQKHSNIKDMTDSRFMLEMQIIDAWEKAEPRTHAKYIEANALRSRVAEVHEGRFQANGSFEKYLTELDQLAERDNQRGSLSKTFKKTFSEEVSYDEQFRSVEGILDAIQAASTTTWDALAKEMVWKRERHDKTSQLVTRENAVTAALADLASRAAESSKPMLSDIDVWEEIGSHSDLADSLRGQVTALYNHYNQAAHFLAQQREVAERPFSNEQKRANEDLTAREALLTVWETHIYTQQADYEGRWEALRQRLREPLEQVLGAKQTALRERSGDQADSIDSYSKTEAQKIEQWEFFNPGKRDERASSATLQRELVQALRDFQLQGLQAGRANFEQALQSFNRRQFSNEEMRMNHDIAAYRELLNTWEERINTLAAIQQVRREYVSNSLTLELWQPIVARTNEGGSELNRGTREQRREAIAAQQATLRGRFTALTADIRAYYGRELEQTDSPRERVQALRDFQLQSVRADRASFERALQNLDRRQFSNEDVLANRDLTTYENVLNRWQEHIATLDGLHQRERNYVSDSLAWERGL